MTDSFDFCEACHAVRAASPLVTNVTNFVTANYTANALLAIGASPIMALCPDEMSDLVRRCNSLVINIGTVDLQQREAMLAAAEAAAAERKPWILDPVGAGASRLRTETSHALAGLHPTVIRGNASEIISLSRAFLGTETDCSESSDYSNGLSTDKGSCLYPDYSSGLAADIGCSDTLDYSCELTVDRVCRQDTDYCSGSYTDKVCRQVSDGSKEFITDKHSDGASESGAHKSCSEVSECSTGPTTENCCRDASGGPKGVDSAVASEDARNAAESLSRLTGATVVVSGETDLIVNYGSEDRVVKGGSALMREVTGMGCTATALIAAFLAIESPQSAAEHAMQLMSSAGAQAAAASGHQSPAVLASATAGGSSPVAMASAAARQPAPGTFAVAFIDSLKSLTFQATSSETFQATFLTVVSSPAKSPTKSPATFPTTPLAASPAKSPAKSPTKSPATFPTTPLAASQAKSQAKSQATFPTNPVATSPATLTAAMTAPQTTSTATSPAASPAAASVDLSLYLVTDRAIAGGRSLTDIVLQAVAGGVTIVQLREKDMSTADFIAEARELKAALNGSGIPLIINDRVDVALASGADGVHIGQRDMPYAEARRLLGPGAIIGLSAENLEQVLAANDLDVDYIGISPVFDTSTKTDTAPAFGLDGLRAAVAASKHPCVAIGGINAANAGEVAQCGAAGIAVVSAIVGSADPEEAARILKAAFTNKA